MSQELIGGYSAWNFDLDATAKNVFEQALEDIIGVDYAPIASSTQVVNGTNYCFLASGTPVVLEEHRRVFLAKIFVYVDPNNDVHLIDIQQVAPIPRGLMGGWTSWSFPASADAMQVFDKALDGWRGVEYKAVGNTSRVIAGAVYCFLTKATPVYPNAKTGASLVTIVAPLNESPHIESITKVMPGQAVAAPVA